MPSSELQWIIYSDGASRGNPGPASIGAVVYGPDGEEVRTVSERIGHGTNNEAEYQAAIAGVEAALALGAKHVELRMDSELVARQLEHRYKVRNERLKPFFNRLVDLRCRFDSFSVISIPRAKNARADALANEALDRAPG